MTPSFRARIRAGELLIAPMMTLGAPEVAELFASLGFDWLFIDAEHTPMEAADIQPLLRAAGQTPCIPRLAAGEATSIGKVLDAGAAGVMVAQVNTADQAREIVALAKYAPQGRRGRGLGRAHGYGVTIAEYSATANDTTAVIVQAEHRDAVRNIGEIVSVEGVDAVLIGPYDLASSYGRPGEVEHPEVRRAIDEIHRACAAARMPIGTVGLSAEAVRPYIDLGFTLIVAGIDVLFLGAGAKGMLDALRHPTG
jgi:2-keto-3-deoxy-L-rhamnonate aldolase RhmA